MTQRAPGTRASGVRRRAASQGCCDTRRSSWRRWSASLAPASSSLVRAYPDPSWQLLWHCCSTACWKARKFQSRAPACTCKGRLTPDSASVQASPIRPSWCRRARSTCWRRLWRSQTLGTASAHPCRHARSRCVHSRVPIMPLAEQWTLHPHLSGDSQLKASTPRQHGTGLPTQIAGGVYALKSRPVSARLTASIPLCAGRPA